MRLVNIALQESKPKAAFQGFLPHSKPYKDAVYV